MKWPRGKYNGRRIIGMEVEWKWHPLHWYRMPCKTRYMAGFHWLCFSLWLRWVYE